MTGISYETIGKSMLEAIPELEALYKDELKWRGDEKPGAHILIGDVLTPFIISALESPENKDLLQRVFDFLERLSNHPDKRVQELVAFSVCERLGDKVEWFHKSRIYMGQSTLKLCNEVQQFWGRENKKIILCCFKLRFSTASIPFLEASPIR